MQAGDLDRQITVQRRGATQDGAGQPVETWSELYVLRANVVEGVVAETDATLPGRRGIVTGIELARTAVKMTVRYRPEITQADRVLYHGHYHDIVSLFEAGRKEWTVIVAERSR